AAIPEGNGSVLDNTLLVWGNELSVGNTHSHKSIPFVVIGNAGGQFKTGRFIDYGSVSNNRLLISVMQAMGVNQTTFGDHMFASDGPLTGLAG
ncbi:MAG TPA: hypothetical protein VG963_26580, partial [Polyangiaceae bacterium]|nr:hypothetical protein [Polyangiaceae bacterium]